MKCTYCNALFDRLESIQFLEGGEVIVVGHCPHCDRDECATEAFIPVFVDELQPVINTKSGRHACYLLTTPGQTEQLHVMARKLRLGQPHFHPSPLPHYDLTPEQRERALILGAVPIDRQLFIRIIHRWRQK